ncbi:MAG: DUF4153 domain-containing protein [Lachnospiraceae bacterium]|nr:DUF4153 domain-containing protein [Lachnospiraceae bacterium]
MSKFGNLVKNTFSYIGGLFSTHPLTFCTIVAGTLTAFLFSFIETDALHLDYQVTRPAEAVFLQLICFLFVFGLAVFCIESSPLKQKMPLFVSIPVYIVTALIAFSLGSLSYAAASSSKDMLLSSTFLSYSDLIGTERIISITFGLGIILLCLGIFFSYRKLEDSFSGYLANLYSKLFFAYIVNLVLIVGVAALTGIFTVLLWGDFEVIFFAAFMLITGGYLLMRIIASFVEGVQTPNAFISVLLRFVLHSMCIIAYVIIYVYMIKITILQEFPSNSVFAILTSLFVISMPIAYMCRSLMEAQATPAFFKWSARFMPYIFSPFILLQIYTVAVRIRQYGLTPKRYFGLLFVAFEIVFIVLYAIFERTKERKMSVLLLVFAACAFVSTWVPGLNAIDFSKTVQTSTLRAYLKELPTFANDPKQLASRASAGYSYLYENDRDYLVKTFSEEEREVLAKLKSSSKTEADTEMRDDRYRTWSMDVNALDMDISGYDHMQYAYLCAIGTKGGNGTDAEIDKNAPANLKSAKLYLTDLENTVPYPDASDLFRDCKADKTLDLSAYAQDFMDLSMRNYNLKINDEDYNAAMQEMQIIPLDDGNAFFVMQADLRYDVDTNEIMEILLQGYYLN